jgi:tetratricopeptide (TPR) repeat protein
MYRLRKYGFLVCITLMGSLSSLEAAADFAKTPEEEVMCQALIYNGRDTSDRGNWMHMHHFCDCMRFTNRAYAAIGNWNAVHGNLQAALDGCDYVLRNTTPDFYMRAEVHLQKGKALRLDRQENKAIGELMEAIKGNPELAQAYVELADIQARNKKSGEALKTVTEGLRHAPDFKPLKRRYTELGGKLPYPAPIKTAPVETQAAKPGETAASTPSSPAEPTTGTPATVTPAAEPIAAPKIGSPKNPYCRFCPD